MSYLPNSRYSKAPQHNSCICLLAGCRAEFLLPPSHHLGSGTCGQIVNIGSTYHHPLNRSSDGIEIYGSCRVIPNNSAGMHVGNPGCHCSYNCHICKVLQIWLWGFWCIQVSHYGHKTSGQSRRPYQHHSLSRWRYWLYRGPWHANRRPGWPYLRERPGPAMWSHHHICLVGLLRDRHCLLFVNWWT